MGGEGPSGSSLHGRAVLSIAGVALALLDAQPAGLPIPPLRCVVGDPGRGAGSTPEAAEAGHLTRSDRLRPIPASQRPWVALVGPRTVGDDAGIHAP